ncbi:M23 family metallopeptidase [Flavobacteriaceae bacterium AU392]|nr:M23 family peptidase [Flavobacteriaceae bacterium]RKM85767.1 M23 family metallopeptidase [Flavobacteriaceae bacterium AU392]
MPKGFFFLFILSLQFCFAQNPYPQDYFRSPLDIPIILAGTFAELRSNHFHSGMDIKTQRREGLKVITAAKGYISRIKISHWGYGKALYVTHPNGYVSVYAHLQKFSPKIEAFIKQQQYKKETFEIELFPAPETLSVSTNEVIAFSGNTGGSSAPHLHFELRDKNERPINPMLFGIDTKDTRRPDVTGIFAYPINDSAHVDTSNNIKKLRLIPLENGNYTVEQINAHGKIGFGIITTDKLDLASNKNGVSNIQTFFNGSQNFEIDFKRFSFNETKHINRLIDYSYYQEHKDRIQKLFLQSNNPLSIYKNIDKGGYLEIQDSTSNIYKIKVTDFKGNETTVSIEISGKKINHIQPKRIKTTNHYIYTNQSITLQDKGVSVFLPKETFYDDLFIDFKVSSDTLILHNSNTPTQKYFSINYDINNYTDADKDKLFIARLNKYNNKTYIPTTRKGNILTSRTNVLGRYVIASDTEAPTITPINFKSQKWISNERYLKLKIDDKLSGISNYRATINGKWVLMEYEPKKKLLVHDFNDAIITDTEQNLKLIIIDNVGNSSTFETTYYRK